MEPQYQYVKIPVHTSGFATRSMNAERAPHASENQQEECSTPHFVRDAFLSNPGTLVVGILYALARTVLSGHG